MAEYLYIVKTIEDNKVQLATRVDIEDGVMLCDGKICAVLKRYTPPVDMTEVMADVQRFSGSVPTQPKPAEKKPQHPLGPAPAPVRPAPVKPEVKPEPKPEVKLEPKRSPDGMIRRLSDLKEGPGNYYSKVHAKYHTGDRVKRLQALADAYWGECDRVLIDKPGNTPALRLEAISRLEKYWESMTITAGSNRSLADYGKCSDSKYLTFEYYFSAGGPCYDGGCHSYDPDSRSTLTLSRRTEEEFLKDKQTARDVQIGHAPYFRYQTELPFQEETEVVMWNILMSVKNPMGIAGYYCISVSNY